MFSDNIIAQDTTAEIPGNKQTKKEIKVTKISTQSKL